jgi:hypothetical protein
MQINEEQVRGLGGRIRTVGQDAESYLRGMSGALEQGCSGNEGFAAVTTLRQTFDRLGQLAGTLAGESQRTGDKVCVAAANHGTNDNRQAGNFRGFSGLINGGN